MSFVWPLVLCVQVDQFMLSIIEKLKASKSEDGEEVDTVEVRMQDRTRLHSNLQHHVVL